MKRFLKKLLEVVAGLTKPRSSAPSIKGMEMYEGWKKDDIVAHLKARMGKLEIEDRVRQKKNQK